MLTYSEREAIRKKYCAGTLSAEERAAMIIDLEQHIKESPTNEAILLLAKLRGGPDPRDIGWRRGGDWGHFSDREYDS